jgi:lipopolysaccharide export system permease protein
MPTTFDRYLLARYGHAFLILFASTYGLFVVIDGFTNVDAFQEAAPETGEMLRVMAGYYAVQACAFFDMMAPILAIVSVLVVVGMLQKHGEIAPILAAGVPVFRLLRPFVFGAVLVNALALANQDLLIPRFAQQLQCDREDLADEGRKIEPAFDYVTHIRIDGRRLYLADQRVEDANFVLPTPEVVDDLTTLAAREAIWKPAGPRTPAGWHLCDVTPRYAELPLTGAGRHIVYPMRDPADVFVATDISFDQLSGRGQSHHYLPTGELVRRIRNPAYGTATVRAQVIHLHHRLVAPVANVLCVFVAVPLILRRESRSLVTNMAVCALVLGSLYGVAQACGYLGAAGLLPPDLAAWTPAIASGMLGAWLSGIVQT